MFAFATAAPAAGQQQVIFENRSLSI